MGHRMYSIPLVTDTSGHVVTRSAARTADSADPTTDMQEAVPHPTTDHNRNTSHRVKLVIASSSSSPSPFPHYALSPPCRRNCLLRMFTIATHQVCGQTASIFVCLDGTPRPAVCSRASPVPLCHPSFFYNLYDYALQSFPLLSSADPLFFVQGVHSAVNLPLLP